MTEDPQTIRGQIIVAVVAGLILAALGYFGSKALSVFNGNSSPALASSVSPSASGDPSSAPAVSTGAGTVTTARGAASPTSPGHSYQTETLSLLCSYCTGNQSVGNHALHYTDSAVAGFLHKYVQSPVLDGAGTSCQSIAISFTGNQPAQNSAATVFLKVIQQKSRVVLASAKPGTIATMSVSLDGGPVFIAASVSTADHGNDIEVLMNITGSCYTADGRP